MRKIIIITSVLALISLAGCDAVPKYRRLLHPQAGYQNVDGSHLALPKGVKVSGAVQLPIVTKTKQSEQQVSIEKLSKPPTAPIATIPSKSTSSKGAKTDAKK